MAPLAARHPRLKKAPSHAGRSVPTPVPRSPGFGRGVRADLHARGCAGSTAGSKALFFTQTVFGWIVPRAGGAAAVQKLKPLLLGTLRGSAPWRRILPFSILHPSCILQHPASSLHPSASCILQPPASFPHRSAPTSTRENHGMGTAPRMLCAALPPSLPSPPSPLTPTSTPALRQALVQAPAGALGDELRQVLEVEDEHDDDAFLVLHRHHIHQAAETRGCRAETGSGGAAEGALPTHPPPPPQHETLLV